MGRIIPFQLKSREAERFLLNGKEIPGVQEVEFQYNQNASPLTYLGNSSVNFIPLGNQVGTVNISNIIISNDSFINFTGSSGFNGYLLEKRPLQGFRQEVKKFYDIDINGFISGYMTSYNQSCAIGEIPKTNININVYKDLGLLSSDIHKEALIDWNDNILPQNINNIIYSAPSAYNLNLSIEEITSNLILSYNFTININREPLYMPGTRYPIAVLTKKPITVDFQFELEIDQLTMNYMSKYPNILKTQNINLDLKDFETNNNIVSYNFDNMSLIDISRRASVDNNTIANLTYRGIYL